jgi:hypothetical protein
VRKNKETIAAEREATRAEAKGETPRPVVHEEILPSAPNTNNPNLFPIGEGFGFVLFFENHYPNKELQ